jgi:hypothetical protein
MVSRGKCPMGNESGVNPQTFATGKYLIGGNFNEKITSSPNGAVARPIISPRQKKFDLPIRTPTKLSQVSHIKYGSMYRDCSPQVGQRVDFRTRE